MKTITVEEHTTILSVNDICERCVVDQETVIRMVEQGIVDPEGEQVSEWRFNSSNYLIIRKALRLKNDLAINESGVALALDLLDQIQSMKQEIDYLKKRTKYPVSK